jgi:hypothetical protein
MTSEEPKKEKILCEIRCPKRIWVRKYKRYMTCQNLIVKVAPGSSGEGYCHIKDINTGMRHGTFEFEVDKNYIPPKKNIIKVKKVNGN